MFLSLISVVLLQVYAIFSTLNFALCFRFHTLDESHSILINLNGIYETSIYCAGCNQNKLRFWCGKLCKTDLFHLSAYLIRNEKNFLPPHSSPFLSNTSLHLLLFHLRKFDCFQTCLIFRLFVSRFFVHVNTHRLHLNANANKCSECIQNP